MGGFGFNEARIVTMPGLNTKLSEVAALLALAKLRELEGVAQHRFNLHQLYGRLLPEFTFQRITGQRSAVQFVSVLLPEAYTKYRSEIINELTRLGIGAGRYFAPHLANHPFFAETCVADGLVVTENISQRVISLPMSDFLTEKDVHYISKIFQRVCESYHARQIPKRISAVSNSFTQELS